jgi:hypothetical protein
MKLHGVLAAMALLCIALAIVWFRPVSTPGPFLRDFEAYWSAGSAWNARADPYGRAIWSAERNVAGVDSKHDEFLPFVGPPPALALFSLMARLPYSIAANLWCALLVAAVPALALTVVYAGVRSVPLFVFFTTCALAVGFGPLTSDIALGQMALVAFLAASLVALPLGLWTGTGTAFLALAQPNVAFGLGSLLGRNRATASIAFAVVVTYLVGVLVSGWRWPLDYAVLLMEHAHAERLSVIQMTPAAIVHGLGAPEPVAVAAGIGFAIAALAAALLLWRRVGDGFARFAAVSALAPFVATFFHEHDLLVGFAAAVWCALRTRGAIRAFALAATLLVAIDWLGLAQRPTGIAQSALLALAAGCAFTALGEPGEWRGSLVAGGVVALLFAGASLLAAAHPAPVWPDALGTFHAPARISASGLWHDEQLRTGLLNVNPAWALLRMLPLLGCTLLTLCIYSTSTKGVKRMRLEGAAGTPTRAPLAGGHNFP